MITPPRRNIPATSEPWGREIDGAYRSLDARTTGLENNPEVRAVSAAIDSLSSNVENLSLRQPQPHVEQTKVITNLSSSAGIHASLSWSTDSQFVAVNNMRAIVLCVVKTYSFGALRPEHYIRISLGGTQVIGEYTAGIAHGLTSLEDAYIGYLNIAAGTYPISASIYSGDYWSATTASYEVTITVIPE